MKFNLFRRAEKIEAPQETQEAALPPESMMSSPNQTVRVIVNHMSEEERKLVSDFTNSLMNQSFNCDADLSWQDNYLTIGDAEYLRYYSGKTHESVNSFLRGYWDYDRLGPRTDRAVAEIREEASRLTNITHKMPRLNENITVFRGTTLASFRDYGVQNLSDLMALKGQLFYDPAFASTSTSREKSFFGKDNLSKNGMSNNIEIEYYIASGTSEGVSMSNSQSSYYNEDEREYLLDKDNLNRIMDVKIDGDSAKLKMALIPKELWDR